MTAPVVIVGGGQAGFQVAASLRERKYAGPITIVGDEPGLPYQRPPLSKDYLLGTKGEEALLLRPDTWYADRRIERRCGVATDIDRTARRVELADGTSLTYDHLVLATGARNRELPGPGGDLAGVASLRTVDDARAIRARLGADTRAVVVGGGFIGLEFAAAARTLGASVTVLEAQSRLMVRALTPPMSQYLLDEHREHGVDVRLGVGVTELTGRDGHVHEVVAADGSRLPADLVVVGIGIVPNSELAERCGLAVDDGIVVDDELCTADPHVSAIGDCARYPDGRGGRLRLESVQNACDHARAVAARLTGRRAPYQAVPWFWSTQYGRRLQMAGLICGHDEIVVRGRPESGSFSVFAYAAGRLLGVESVDHPGDHGAARRFLAATHLTCPPATAADLDVDLRELSRRPDAATQPDTALHA